MQFKKAIKNIIFPVIENNGFALMDSAPAYYEFFISDDSLRVIIDKNPWPPAELRVNFCYRDYRGSFSHLELNQLTSYRDLDLFYENQEELEAKLEVIANILETYALTFLVSMRDNHVFRQEEMALLISVDPKKQAADYAKKNLLTMSFELSNFLFLENQISLMRGDTMCNWRENFIKHTNEIVGLTSYYGEIIRRKRRAKWNNGVLEYDQGSGYPDVDVIQYWNYGLFMPAFRLVPHSLR